MKELVAVARGDARRPEQAPGAGAGAGHRRRPAAHRPRPAEGRRARTPSCSSSRPQNNYETSKAQLNQAAGIVGGTDYDVGDEEVVAPEDEDQPLDALVGKAIAARPEIAALREAARVAGGHAELRQGRLRAHALRGGRGDRHRREPHGRPGAGGLVPNWNAGLLLNWPVFQGGLTKAQVHQAQAGLDSIDAQRAVEVLQVRLEVDTARLAVRAAKATIGAVGKTRSTARASSCASPSSASRRASATSSSSTTRRWLTPSAAAQVVRHASGWRARARSSWRPWDEHDARTTPSRPATSAAPSDRARRSRARSCDDAIVVLLLLVVAVGGVAWVVLARAGPGRPAAATAAAASAAENRVIPVLTARGRAARRADAGSRGSAASPPSTRSPSRRRSTAASTSVLFTEGQHVKKGDAARADRSAPLRDPARDRPGRAGPGRRQREERATQRRALQDARASRTSSPSSSTPTSRRRWTSSNAQVRSRPGGDRRGPAQPRLRAHHLAHRRRDRRAPGRPRQRRPRRGHDGPRRGHAARPDRGLSSRCRRTICRAITEAMAGGRAAGRGAEPRRRQARSAQGKLTRHRQRDQPGHGDHPAQGDLRQPAAPALAEPVRQGAAPPLDPQGRAGRAGGGRPARARRGRSRTS